MLDRRSDSTRILCQTNTPRSWTEAKCSNRPCNWTPGSQSQTIVNNLFSNQSSADHAVPMHFEESSAPPPPQSRPSHPLWGIRCPAPPPTKPTKERLLQILGAQLQAVHQQQQAPRVRRLPQEPARGGAAVRHASKAIPALPRSSSITKAISTGISVWGTLFLLGFLEP